MIYIVVAQTHAGLPAHAFRAAKIQNKSISPAPQEHLACTLRSTDRSVKKNAPAQSYPVCYFYLKELTYLCRKSLKHEQVLTCSRANTTM